VREGEGMEGEGPPPIFWPRTAPDYRANIASRG